MDTPTVLRPYLRVSRDKGGRSHSTDEQGTDLARDAETQGWTLGDPYTDKGISASRYATQTRGDFARLMDDLRSGDLTGQILGLWESSRGSRKVGEWVDLLDEMERHGVQVWVSTHRRLYDPANARDRRTLLEDAVDSEYESAKTQGRVLRTFAAELEKGAPHGDVPYGYERIYDPRTRALLEQREVPHEAEVVREIYKRIDAGHAIRAIKTDLEKRGIRTRPRTINRKAANGETEEVQLGGVPFVEQVIRGIALNPTYKGHRRGRRGDTRTYPGNWKPIVSPDLWDRVNARLSDPSRMTHRDSQGRHLMTMTARCARCLAPMTSSQRGGEPPHLRCHANCGIQVNEELFDGVVVELIVGYLSRPDVVAELTRDDGDDPELEQVRADLSAVRRQLAELAAGLADLSISVSMAAKAEPPLLAAEARLVRRERELTVPSRLAEFIGPEDQVRARWKAAPLSARREVARLLFVPGLLGELRVGPSVNGPWCRHESHDRPQQTCRHRILARLQFVRD